LTGYSSGSRTPRF